MNDYGWIHKWSAPLDSGWFWMHGCGWLRIQTPLNGWICLNPHPSSVRLSQPNIPLTTRPTIEPEHTRADFWAACCWGKGIHIYLYGYWARITPSPQAQKHTVGVDYHRHQHRGSREQWPPIPSNSVATRESMSQDESSDGLWRDEASDGVANHCSCCRLLN